MLLKDKVAIITGAGQGIGRSYASGFVAEGAKVVIADINGENGRNVADEINAEGGEALAVQTDVSNEQHTLELAEKAMAEFGKIDILINNAAVFAEEGFKPWNAWTNEEWDRIFAVNVKGMWLCCKAVIPYMSAQRKGKIINISSGTVLLGSPLLLHYAATKGAIVSFTRSLASELGDSNICVNAIAPGFTMSEGVLNMPGTPPGFIEIIKGAQCFKREEQPEDLVGTAVYLASDLSDFVTGQLIAVDGGLTRH